MDLGLTGGNFSKAVSKQVGPLGIRVDTGPEDIASRAVRDTATGRFTEPQEVADLVVFLASDRAANITGSDYLIDGGLIQTL